MVNSFRLVDLIVLKSFIGTGGENHLLDITIGITIMIIHIK